MAREGERRKIELEQKKKKWGIKFGAITAVKIHWKPDWDVTHTNPVIWTNQCPLAALHLQYEG